MRQTYLARLANLQAQIIAAPASESGELIRQFLAHEASTSRNLKHASLLTSGLAEHISKLPKGSLSGCLPYPPLFTLSTIYSLENNTFYLYIHSYKGVKIMYSQVISLPA